MEGGDLIYILLLVAYGIYSLFTSGKKQTEKAEPMPPPIQIPDERKQQPPAPPKRAKQQPQTATDFLEEIERRLAQQRQQTTAKPKKQAGTLQKKAAKATATLDSPKVYNYDKQPIVRDNIDNDSPKTHKADVNYKKKKKRFSLKKDFKFNLRDAVIYKEILSKKY